MLSNLRSSLYPLSCNSSNQYSDSLDSFKEIESFALKSVLLWPCWHGRPAQDALYAQHALVLHKGQEGMLGIYFNELNSQFPTFPHARGKAKRESDYGLACAEG